MTLETKQQGQGASRQWVIGGVVGAVAIVAAILIYHNAGNRAAQQSPYAGVTLPEAATVEVAQSTAPADETMTAAATEAATTVVAGATTAATAVTAAAADAGPVGSISEIQTALRSVGLYQGNVDGKLGPMTKQAIMQFQEAHQLEADGKVGSKTWALLKPYLAKNTASQSQNR